jgi:hypothetical protein
MNIEKKQNCFLLVEANREFTITSSDTEILCDTQCHIPTQYGLTFFDTSVTIDGQTFENIHDWIAELYKIYNP